MHLKAQKPEMVFQDGKLGFWVFFKKKTGLLFGGWGEGVTLAKKETLAYLGH